ncbi:hypothetical protein WDV91_18605 [Curtobacterium flaccumfaciens pv. flaccumfaciens]
MVLEVPGQQRDPGRVRPRDGLAHPERGDDERRDEDQHDRDGQGPRGDGGESREADGGEDQQERHPRGVVGRQRDLGHDDVEHDEQHQGCADVRDQAVRPHHQGGEHTDREDDEHRPAGAVEQEPEARPPRCERVDLPVDRDRVPVGVLPLLERDHVLDRGTDAHRDVQGDERHREGGHPERAADEALPPGLEQDREQQERREQHDGRQLGRDRGSHEHAGHGSEPPRPLTADPPPRGDDREHGEGRHHRVEQGEPVDPGARTTTRGQPPQRRRQQGTPVPDLATQPQVQDHADREGEHADEDPRPDRTLPGEELHEPEQVLGRRRVFAVRGEVSVDVLPPALQVDVLVAGDVRAGQVPEALVERGDHDEGGDRQAEAEVAGEPGHS